MFIHSLHQAKCHVGLSERPILGLTRIGNLQWAQKQTLVCIGLFLENSSSIEASLLTPLGTAKGAVLSSKLVALGQSALRNTSDRRALTLVPCLPRKGPTLLGRSVERVVGEMLVL